MIPLSSVGSSERRHEPDDSAIGLGFLVRIPVEPRDDDQFREFRIGRVVELPDAFGDLEVELLIEAIGETPTRTRLRCPSSVVTRCRVLPGSPFNHIETGATGLVLIADEEEAPPGSPLSYHVLSGGVMALLPEIALQVGSTCQDPDPAEQLRRYELHQPMWRDKRNMVVEIVGAMSNATYGLDELVGSRVTLLAHQAEVIARVLASTKLRYVLADEVGLGKTIEAGVILKGLRRQDPRMRVLIVAPGSLVHQWQRELDDRFWMRFRVLDEDGYQDGSETGAIDRKGIIVAAETLASDYELQHEISLKTWGLLIIDEAHQVRKDSILQSLLIRLSRDAARVLILSATPVQRRRDEYVALLRLLDPDRYERITTEEFTALLSAQDDVRRQVSYLGRGLDPEVFDPDEFVEDMVGLTERLAGDSVLPQLIASVQTHASWPDQALSAAREALAYVSENYRFESRVIRNRRAHLDAPVPIRVLDLTYLYDPSTEERAVLETLLDYLGPLNTGDVPPLLAAEVIRLFLSAAASGPEALAGLVAQRQYALLERKTELREGWQALVSPAAPRRQIVRIAELIAAYPPVDDARALDRVAFLVERWREREATDLAVALQRRSGRTLPKNGRLGRTLAAVAEILGNQRRGKVLVFSSWPETLMVLEHVMEPVSGPRGTAVFRAGLPQAALQQAVDRFQSDPDCRVLLSDELGGEGRNFQIADAIVHVDLPWTPALIEQRIGRVDRIGRSGTVRSVVVAARETTESQLLALWQDAFQLFTASMSGMEIALEGIQDEIGAAVASDPRQGLAELLPSMQKRAVTLREEVEEERYFDLGTIDRRLRDDFRAADERYRNGRALAEAVRAWSSIAGLRSRESDGEIVTYSPRSFGEASMTNAKVVSLPNMEEALWRSRRRNNFEVRGTFNRDVAVLREDLVFFARGSDPWTDFVINNAICADRGRCCAILRLDSPEHWNGLEFLFSLELNSRPLFRLGHGPTKLLAGQGYLRLPTYRVLVSLTGEIVPVTSRVGKAVMAGWEKSDRYRHLGERKGERSNLDLFRKVLPPETWPATVSRLEKAARAHVATEFSFLDDEANDAAEIFAEQARGWRAASRWFRTDVDAESDIREYEEISAALVEGIRHPNIRLESVCCWLLRSNDGQA